MVCQSEVFTDFLSDKNIFVPSSGSEGLVRTLYRTVANGVEDVFAGQTFMESLINRLGQQAMDYAAGQTSDELEDDDLLTTSQDLLPQLNHSRSVSVQNYATAGEVNTFTAPICDFFVEIFGLKTNNNWLRRQAIVIVLQHIMGGTIER